MQETQEIQVQFLGQEESLEQEMATHSSSLILVGVVCARHWDRCFCTQSFILVTSKATDNQLLQQSNQNLGVWYAFYVELHWAENLHLLLSVSLLSLATKSFSYIQLEMLNRRASSGSSKGPGSHVWAFLAMRDISAMEEALFIVWTETFFPSFPPPWA